MDVKTILEVSKDDLAILSTVLSEEIGAVKNEIHHSNNHEVKAYLIGREQQLRELLQRVDGALKQIDLAVTVEL